MTTTHPPWLSFVLRWASWLAVGFALVLLAAFVELSEDLFRAKETSVKLLGVDAAVLRAVARARQPWLDGLAVDLTSLGSPLLVALFTIALGSVLLARGDARGAVAIAAAAFAAGLITLAVKPLLGRPRPDLVARLVEGTGFSYPSGHSLASAAVYLTAAFVVARHLPLARQQAGAVIFAAAVVLMIGFSRVYLGVHYPSDVLGGILLGAAWASLAAAALHRLDRRARLRGPRA